MTEQEIIRNAEEYIDENTQGVVIDTNVRNFLLDVYLAGAHSRDEEIKELKEEIKSLQEQYNTCFDGFKKRGTKMGELMKENVKLRNPWISVDERLPEITYPSLGESDFVFVHVVNKDTGAEWIELPAKYNEQFHDWMANDFTWIRKRSGVVTHWMPIPELKKGE